MPTKKTVPKKKLLPKSMQPMLATLVDKPFDKEGWLYEVKWDGYRALAVIDNGKVSLLSRNNKSFNEKFYPITEQLKKLKKKMIIDGEVVVLNDRGISDFGSLQNWRSEADGQLYYYVFDILWLEDKELITLPLTERQKILRKTIKEQGSVRISQAFEESGLEFFETAKRMGLEGIMAKKKDSAYLPGLRSNDWLKIKSNQRQEMVIGGYTINDDTAKQFSSLLVGVFDGKKLRYTGKVGTGFNDATQKAILQKLKPLLTDKPAFEEIPDINKP
ncbi:MAG TPA: non-homologous end-joining DNA ligase, partial [Ferruginibacter sp.]|nr:non-homologous end-joining DNA ligase [Ferruginibacter sp.]